MLIQIQNTNLESDQYGILAMVDTDVARGRLVSNGCPKNLK